MQCSYVFCECVQAYCQYDSKVTQTLPADKLVKYHPKEGRGSQ